MGSLTVYNDHSNTPLSNANIRESIRKVMEEKSITGSNNVTAGALSHASSAQRENANLNITCEKLDKLNELVDAVKNLDIIDAKYYESNTATASDAQGDLTSNLKQLLTLATEIVKKILSYRTIPVLPPPTNPGVAVIKLTPQTLLMPATKEIVLGDDPGDVWKSRTPWRFIRTGVNGRTPGGIDSSIIIVETSSPDIIGIIGNTPPCSLNLRQGVGDIWKSTSPGLVRQSQRLYAAVDGKLSNNSDSTSIFSKIIGEKISNSSSQDPYTRFRINLEADTVQTHTPQFVDMELLTINVLDEGSGISTAATRI